MRAFAQIQAIGGSLKASLDLAFVDSFLVEIPDSAYIIKHWEDDKIKTNVSWWHLCQMMILLLEMISSGGGVTNHHRVPIVTFDPIVPLSYHCRRYPQIMVVLRASYCSSPSHRFVWGWPLLWEEDFASKRIPSFPPLPPPSLAFFSSPSRLFLILFLLLRLFSLPFSIESHFMKLAWIAKNSLQSRKILHGFYIVSVIFGHLHDTWLCLCEIITVLIEANNLALYYLLVINSLI